MTLPSRPPREVPSEIWSIMGPALQVGTISGFSGILVGSAAGIMRSTAPVLFAVASGVQWFTLGTSFWATRSAVLHRWGDRYKTPADQVYASSFAGAVSGGAGGLLRGRKNVLYGVIMFTLFGAAGQTIYDMADAKKHDSFANSTSSGKRTWMDAKWSPVKALSDQEYEDMLQEKLLRVDAEIALVDETIAQLKTLKVEKSVSSGLPSRRGP